MHNHAYSLSIHLMFITFQFFLWTGLSDHVRCFHCGNGLRNWEKDDDPWEEHARWYPECNYVLLKKGQEFIDKVRCIELCCVIILG